MALTPLTVLGELIVDALIAANGDATPEQVIERIRMRFTPTAEDAATHDGDDRPAWQARVYTARRHLSDDDLVFVKGRRWILTAAGKDSADRRLEMVKQPSQPTSPFQPSVIAAPLMDPDMRAGVMGRPVAESEPMPVVIELNLDYRGGRGAAYEALKRYFDELGLADSDHPMPEMFDDYVLANLSMETIQSLVRMDNRSEPTPVPPSPARVARKRTSGSARKRVGERLPTGKAEPEPGTAARQRVIYRVWPNFPIRPLIDVSARTIKADAVRRSFAARGKGVVWAVIDSGIDASHPHFTAGNNLRASDVAGLHRDFTQSREPGTDTIEAALQDAYGSNGHGTGVASIIAGYLREDTPAGLVDVVSERITSADDIAPTRSPRVVAPADLSGMAPDTHLVSLKVMSSEEAPSNMDRVIAALRYVQLVNGDNDKVTKIHGVNLSVGYEFDPQWFACGQSPLCQAVDRLVRSGVVVVVASGNTGYATFGTWRGRRGGGLTMSINDPGNAERAITVGSTHRSSPHTYGVSYFSSKGPTGDGRLKPDLVAPGERITAATAQISGQRPAGLATYTDMSGTSFAAPHVSGAIAAFLSIRDEFVTRPEEVKRIFVEAATPLGRERQFEGGGLLDLMRALQSI